MSPQIRPIKDRLWEKVSFSGYCWWWTGSSAGPPGWKAGTLGIGSRTDGTRRTAYAPRLVYELYVGPIPEGWHVHHYCRNRLCVRPSHLTALPAREHVLIHDSAPAINARKTHCSKCGRPLSGDNLLVYTGRQCRVCTLEYAREWKRRRRATQNPYAPAPQSR